jgi:hypothetical protein
MGAADLTRDETVSVGTPRTRLRTVYTRHSLFSRGRYRDTERPSGPRPKREHHVRRPFLRRRCAPFARRTSAPALPIRPAPCSAHLFKAVPRSALSSRERSSTTPPTFGRSTFGTTRTAKRGATGRAPPSAAEHRGYPGRSPGGCQPTPIGPVGRAASIKFCRGRFRTTAQRRSPADPSKPGTRKGVCWGSIAGSTTFARVIR